MKKKVITKKDLSKFAVIFVFALAVALVDSGLYKRDNRGAVEPFASALAGRPPGDKTRCYVLGVVEPPAGIPDPVKIKYTADTSVATGALSSKKYEYIVIHWTGVEDERADKKCNLEFILEEGRDYAEKHGWSHIRGYHFYVNPDGSIVQPVSLEKKTNHVFDSPTKRSGPGSSIAANNSNSIGISAVCGESELGGGTSAQKSAIVKLAKALQVKYGIPNNNVYGHRELDSGKDEGEGIDIAEIIRSTTVPGSAAIAIKTKDDKEITCVLKGGVSAPTSPPPRRRYDRTLERYPPRDSRPDSARTRGGRNSDKDLLSKLMKQKPTAQGSGGGASSPRSSGGGGSYSPYKDYLRRLKELENKKRENKDEKDEESSFDNSSWGASTSTTKENSTKKKDLGKDGNVLYATHSPANGKDDKKKSGSGGGGTSKPSKSASVTMPTVPARPVFVPGGGSIIQKAFPNLYKPVLGTRQQVYPNNSVGAKTNFCDGSEIKLLASLEKEYARMYSKETFIKKVGRIVRNLATGANTKLELAKKIKQTKIKVQYCKNRKIARAKSRPPAHTNTYVAPKAKCERFTKFLQFGDKGKEVLMMNTFLTNNAFLTGNPSYLFDKASLVAVKKFQAKYAGEILAPWGLKSPTGFWGRTTTKKANEIKCGE